MMPWREWQEIDKYVWHKCKACGGLFTDPHMREVYEERAAAHDQMLAQGIRAETPGSCPCCGGRSVRGIEKVGPKDKRKILVRSYWLDVVEWIQKTRRKILVAFS